jgi:hypothetical protein
MKNFRRVALAAGIALSAVAFSPKAQAQTADVDFTGAVPATCTVNSVTPGVLELVASHSLLADNADGTFGTINVTCNAGTTFQVTSITDNGTSASVFNTVDRIIALVQNTSTTIASGEISPNGSTTITLPLNTPSSLQASPINNAVYRVHLNVRNNNSVPLPVANYGVRVTVGLTPQ